MPATKPVFQTDAQGNALSAQAINPSSPGGYTEPVFLTDPQGRPVASGGSGGGITGLNGVTGLWAGTQAEYDAVTPKVSTVVYVVKA